MTAGGWGVGKRHTWLGNFALTSGNDERTVIYRIPLMVNTTTVRYHVKEWFWSRAHSISPVSITHSRGYNRLREGEQDNTLDLMKHRT